jgi:hypothetical protein
MGNATAQGKRFMEFSLITDLSHHAMAEVVSQAVNPITPIGLNIMYCISEILAV